MSCQFASIHARHLARYDPRFNRRLAQDVRYRLRTCIRDRVDLQDPTSPPCLCHGDFNEKNIHLTTDGMALPGSPPIAVSAMCSLHLSAAE